MIDCMVGSRCGLKGRVGIYSPGKGVNGTSGRSRAETRQSRGRGGKRKAEERRLKEGHKRRGDATEDEGWDV